MSTTLLRREHRLDWGGLSLRAFAANMASCFPRMRRAEARLFDEPPPGHFIHDPEDGPEENEGQASAGGAP